MPLNNIYIFILLSLFSINTNADIEVIDNHFRTTYEEIEISDTEKMGLLGSSFLFNKKINTVFELYSGLGIYSSVSGDRGGFFTGGLELGVNTQLAGWQLDTGVFIGGGGGASAPQGGGLMLRPHIGLLYDLQLFKIGVNYNYVTFPNGNISSQHWGLQLDIPFQVATVNKSTPISNMHNFKLADVYFSFNTQFYKPQSGVKTRAGNMASNMKVAGFSAGRYFSNNAFFFGEASGAYGGNSDGYAEFLGGLGYSLPLSKRFSITGKAALGASGGGDVDTQGGLIYKISSGIQYHVSQKISFNLDYGIIDAIKGDFTAQFLRPSLNYNFNMAVPSSSKYDRNHKLDLTKLNLVDWSMTMSVSRYLASDTLRKTTRDSTPVDLINLKVNRKLSNRFYLSGQAAAAYEGKSGGYATGLVGLGVNQPLTQNLSFQAEALIGAGGGGNIASNGGAIIQPMAGFSYQFSRNISLQAMGGKIKALKGELNAHVVDLGFIYNFSTLQN